ncbi:MAG: DNA repair protein RadC [Defluviicoccus sp.]|nr:DNA repair protein RadC [Defluviicoccus sp.]MDE0274458.1 DNA repair protein RadC [Defluviicoccus sp.]
MHASQPLPRVSDPARPPPAETLAARLLDAGGEALDDADLLQLVIAPFHPPTRARQLAHALLDRFATPARVLAAPPGRLIAVPGLGEASVAAIKAAETLGIGLARAALPDRILPVLDSYEKVIRYCRALSGHRPAEEFRLLFLDHRNRLIRDELHQRGTLAHTPAYPREICIRALETDAASLIAIHNHPSNDPTPSKADRDTTDRIAAALKTIGVALHDHIVVTPSATFSFRAHGLL